MQFQTIAVDGVRLEYRRIAGERGRPTLVLLHEGLGCVALWRDFPDALAAATRCPVFSYSRAGYGGSDPISLPRPLQYMSIEAARVLPRLLECAAIDDFALIGHSDGATIALVYAGQNDHPGLRGVVAIAPHVFAEASGIASIAAIDATYRHGDLRQRLAKYHADNVDIAFRGWCDSWLHPDFRHWSVEADLPGITVPVLLIQGTADEYGTAEQLRRIEQAVSGPVSSVWFEGCGHAPQQERRTETLAAIRHFCHAHLLPQTQNPP